MDIPPLDQLQAFIVFVESTSMSVAANRLAISQPALSKKLAAIDQRYSAKLFVRHGTKKILSEFGSLFYQAVRHRLRDLETAVEGATRHVVNPATLELRIAARREVIHELAPGVSFPGRLEFIAMSRINAEGALRSRTVDMIVTQTALQSSQFYSRQLFTSPVRFCVSRALCGSHPEVAAADPEFLSNTPCIVYKQDAPFLAEWIKHIGLTIDQLSITRLCADWYTVAEMVDASVGYSIIPSSIPMASSTATFTIPESAIEPTTFYLTMQAELAPIADQYLEFQGLS